jgi:hypothetical protein
MVPPQAFCLSVTLVKAVVLPAKAGVQMRRKGTTSPQGTLLQPSPPRRRGSRCDGKEPRHLKAPRPNRRPRLGGGARCDGKEPRHLKAPRPNRRPRLGGGPGATERNDVTSRHPVPTVTPAKAGVQVRWKGTTSPQGTLPQPSPPRRRGSRCGGKERRHLKAPCPNRHPPRRRGSRCDGKEPRHLKAPCPNRHPREGGGPGATERNDVTSRHPAPTVSPAKAGVQAGCDAAGKVVRQVRQVEAVFGFLILSPAAMPSRISIVMPSESPTLTSLRVNCCGPVSTST